MEIKEITRILESWAPRSLQESYDNSGLIIGDQSDTINSALISLDVTEKVIDEAIDEKCEFRDVVFACKKDHFIRGLCLEFRYD